MPRLLLTDEGQNHIWDIERWEIGSGSVSKRHALLKSLSGNYAAGSWAPVIAGESTHIVGTSINSEAADRRKHHFEPRPTDATIPTRKIRGVTRALIGHVNIVQFSVMGPGVKRSHVSLQLPDYCTAPELPCDLAALRSQRCNRPTGSNFASFICNRRGCCLIERRYNRSQFKRVKFQRN